MSLKKLFIKLLLILIGVFVFFMIVFYFGSQPKSKSIAEQFPYSAIVKQEFKTIHVCYAFLNIENRIIENPYRLSMSGDNLNKEETKIYKIPEGTTIKIKDAKAVKMPVSGVTDNLVFGTIFIQELNKNVAFEFDWGENPTYGLYNHDENYDIYDLAPWQETALPYKYFWNGTKKAHDWKTWNENIN